MAKRLSARILLMELVFVLAALMAGWILYSIAMPAYDARQTEKAILQAYREIGDMDLRSLEDEDLALLFQYEDKENLNFCIANAKMKPVYVTNGRRRAVQRHIVWHLAAFSKDPEVERGHDEEFNLARLRGILTQNGKNFYVSIREYSMGIRGVLSAGLLYVGLFLLFFCAGSILAFRYLRRELRPVEDAIGEAAAVAEGQAGSPMPEESEYPEISRLAKGVNWMAGRVREQESRMEEDKERMMRQNVRRERMEKLRKDSIASISHELKTPLAVISSQAEMLGYVQEGQDYYISSIMEEVGKMSDLVSRLLDVSAMERRMESMVQKDLDMKEIMEYVFMKHEGLAKKRKVRLDAFLEEGCVTYGDREYIEQAINNYMMNALEHTQMGGSIRMTLKRKDGMVRIGVYNEGKRIPPEEMESIWAGYYSSRDGAAREENGFSHAGLGLYIVKSVAAMHGGDCGVDNLEDGVEFWITLPEAGNGDAIATGLSE